VQDKNEEEKREVKAKIMIITPKFSTEFTACKATPGFTVFFSFRSRWQK
jgi:hypothetical protein